MFLSRILSRIINSFNKKSNGISNLQLTIEQTKDLEQMLSDQQSVLSKLFQEPCDDCWAIFKDPFGYDAFYISKHKEYDYNKFEYLTKNGFKHIGYMDSSTYKKYYSILTVRNNTITTTNTVNRHNMSELNQNH